MVDAAAKVQEICAKISISSEREVLVCLQELSTVLGSSGIQPRDLRQLVPLNLLFSCLKTQNDEQIKLCKGILQKLLLFEKADAVALQHHDVIIEGLNHPSSEVRELCVSQLERCSSNVNGLVALLEKKDILQYTARTIGDEKLECAKLAANIFINVAKYETGLKLIFKHNLQSEFNELLLKKDVIRFRVYELFVRIQALSDEAHMACKNCGILDKLLAEFDGDDVLLRMNCIELLTQLVALASRNGRVFLEEKDMVTKLKNLLTSAESDPLTSLMIPGVIKFFGNLAQTDPAGVIEQYPVFLHYVLSFLNCGELALMNVAIETIGILGRTVAGMKALFADATQTNEIMGGLCRHVQSTVMDSRERALDSLASTFWSVDPPTEDLSELVKGVYNKLTSQPMDMLMSIAKQPFQGLRCRALKVLQSLAKYKWAQQEMVQCAGFLEYLLDRRTEPEKEGKEQKYALIVELVHSETGSQVFDKPYFLRLREYEQEGPFFARAQAAVAFEGTN